MGESVPPEPFLRRTDRRGVGNILWQVMTAPATARLIPPEPPEDLAEMPLLLRLHACLRLFLLDIEYALSPDGHIRGICKFGCRISLVLAFLLLCMAAVLACLVLVLGVVVMITRQLVEILWNLLTAALLVIALLILAGSLLAVVRLLVRHARNQRHQ